MPPRARKTKKTPAAGRGSNAAEASRGGHGASAGQDSPASDSSGSSKHRPPTRGVVRGFLQRVGPLHCSPILWAATVVVIVLVVLVAARLRHSEDVVDVGTWSAEEVQAWFDECDGGVWKAHGAAFAGLDGKKLAAMTNEHFKNRVASTGNIIFNDWRAYVAAPAADAVDVQHWSAEEVRAWFDEYDGGMWKAHGAAFAGLHGKHLAAMTNEHFKERLAFMGDAIFNDWRAYVAAQSAWGVATATLPQPWVVALLLLLVVALLLLGSVLYYKATEIVAKLENNDAKLDNRDAKLDNRDAKLFRFVKRTLAARPPSSLTVTSRAQLYKEFVTCGIVERYDLSDKEWAPLVAGRPSPPRELTDAVNILCRGLWDHETIWAMAARAALKTIGTRDWAGASVSELQAKIRRNKAAIADSWKGRRARFPYELASFTPDEDDWVEHMLTPQLAKVAALVTSRDGCTRVAVVDTHNTPFLQKGDDYPLKPDVSLYASDGVKSVAFGLMGLVEAKLQQVKDNETAGQAIQYLQAWLGAAAGLGNATVILLGAHGGEPVVRVLRAFRSADAGAGGMATLTRVLDSEQVKLDEAAATRIVDILLHISETWSPQTVSTAFGDRVQPARYESSNEHSEVLACCRSGADGPDCVVKQYKGSSAVEDCQREAYAIRVAGGLLTYQKPDVVKPTALLIEPLGVPVSGQHPLSADHVPQLVSQLARAHQHGIVHADIRPSNVILIGASRTEIGTATIIDWAWSAKAGTKGRLCGSWRYAAPDVLAAFEDDTVESIVFTTKQDVAALVYTIYALAYRDVQRDLRQVSARDAGGCAEVREIWRRVLPDSWTHYLGKADVTDLLRLQRLIARDVLDQAPLESVAELPGELEEDTTAGAAAGAGSA